MNPAPLRRFLFALSVLAVVTLALSAKFYPAIFINKTPGSFEYFRAGERLLDKGRYREAVTYFERAHSSSPENKDISAGLVYAYSRYADSLERALDHDRAIEYLTKACDVERNTITVRNLAVSYLKRALSLGRKGEYLKAVEDLTRGREIASDSHRQEKAVAAWLFAEGVRAHKEGRERLALLCLRESMLAREDAPSLDLLGDIYYKARDLDKARFYWSMARRLRPGDRIRDKKLRRLAKEIMLSRSEKPVALPHFDISYERGLAVDAPAVSAALEKAYLEVGEDLAFFPASKTVVIFYSQDDFKDIFKLSKAIRAFYDGNIRIPFPQDIHIDDIRRYIYHEYTHAVVSAKTNNNCAVWLNEGIAMMEEFRGQRLPLEGLADSFKDDSTLSIDRMDEAFSKSGGTDGDMRQNYLIAYSVVRYIVDSWGIDGLRDILARIATGQHAMNAIDDELLLSEKEFEKRWKGYVRKGIGRNAKEI